MDWKINVPVMKYARKSSISSSKKKGKNQQNDLYGANLEKWTPVEDSLILRAVETFGPNWNLLAHLLSNKHNSQSRSRTPKQVFDRYSMIKPSYKTSSSSPWM